MRCHYGKFISVGPLSWNVCNCPLVDLAMTSFPSSPRPCRDILTIVYPWEIKTSKKGIVYPSSLTKSLKMKTNRRLHVGERFFIAITFAHNDAFEAERISDVSVRVLLNNNLLGLHGCLLEANTSTNTSFCSLKSRSHALPINLRTRCHKLLRFLFHAHTQRRLLINLFLRRVLAH